MKIVVYPHDLQIGGSQLNAIEIAAGVRDLGHEVVIFGCPGALNAEIDRLGLEFVASPEPGRRPSPSVVRALGRLIDRRGIDVVHGYEWPPGLEAYVAARRRPAVCSVATVMSMGVERFVPRTMPLLVGTEQIAAAERDLGRSLVGVLEPPVDLVANAPGAVPGDDFRARWRIDPDKAVIVCVTRLSHQLKFEGIIAAMDAVADISSTVPAQLVLVGDGPAGEAVSAHAEVVNARAGARTVILTGQLADPRPAYAVADVALGMGGSALRAMAFATPLVVQGENGFWRLLDADSVADFLWSGWYGYGERSASGAARLAHILVPLLADAGRRAALGHFARSVVAERFSLADAAARQVAFYEQALQAGHNTTRLWTSDAAAALRFGRYHLVRRTMRTFAGRSPDSLNAPPVAARAAVAAMGTRDMPRRRAAAGGKDIGRGLLVYFAGVSWDAVTGTDRQLATALARDHEVLWVDPPTSWLAHRRARSTTAAVTEVADSITRLHTVGPPGVSRRGVRAVARRLMWRELNALLASRQRQASVFLASCPDPVLAMVGRTAALKIYFATDDFVAGAALLGYCVPYLRRSRNRNARAADVTVAVSDQLARVLGQVVSAPRVLRNGCAADVFAPVPGLAQSATVELPHPIAGVVGHLNDRLDVALLEAVADDGHSLLLVGPRSSGASEVGRRFDALTARDNVQWVDAQPFERLPEFLAAIDVGLTPYADTAFNRSSFPLKSLEYLAAGIPVVSTDLPAVRELGSELITRAVGCEDFVQAVRLLLKEPGSAEQVSSRQQFARRNSWQSRAEQLTGWIGELP